MTTEDLLESLLGAEVVVLLRNAAGTMELRGQDLKLKRGESWITVYHGDTDDRGGTESRSHLHLRRGTFQLARIREPEGRTPVLEFWPEPPLAESAARPPLSVIFPSFYDWAADKAPIRQNRAWFADWVARYGTTFTLKAT